MKCYNETMAKKKILIISDLHLGESRESTTHSGITRQANSQAKGLLESLVPKFKEMNPDLIVNMGDVLRDTYDKEIDEKNIRDAVALLNSTNLPIVNLLGNHELRAFSLVEMKNIYTSLGESREFYGVADLGSLQIMWLGMELDEKNRAFVSKEKIDWIKNKLETKKPTLIFSHYSLLPIDSKGSFYFEEEPEGMHYKNIDEIQEVFKDSSARIFINAHVHLLTYQQQGSKHYISNPAFSENIAAEKYIQNNPGIYSILDIDENKFIFTSYSGNFCFSKIQGNLS